MIIIVTSRLVAVYNRKVACVWWVRVFEVISDEHIITTRSASREGTFIRKKKKKRKERENEVAKEQRCHIHIVLIMNPIRSKICKDALVLATHVYVYIYLTVSSLSISSSHYHVYERMNTNAFSYFVPDPLCYFICATRRIPQWRK